MRKARVKLGNEHEVKYNMLSEDVDNRRAPATAEEYQKWFPNNQETEAKAEERKKLMKDEIIGVESLKLKLGNMDRSYAKPDAWKRLLGEDYTF